MRSRRSRACVPACRRHSSGQPKGPAMEILRFGHVPHGCPACLPKSLLKQFVIDEQRVHSVEVTMLDTMARCHGKIGAALIVAPVGFETDTTARIVPRATRRAR
jgi:hypothetical protein